MSRPPLAAVLFDIDGTLMFSSDIYLEALTGAAADILGIHTPFELSNGAWGSLGGVSTEGFIDAQCFRLLASQAGVEVRPEDLDDFNDNYVKRYQALVLAGDPVGELKEGITEVLEAFREANVPLALATGNAHRVAKLKLDALGIGHFFDYSPSAGFGDTHENRNMVGAGALRHLGISDYRPAVLVGDTGADMQSARANSLIGIGFAGIRINDAEHLMSQGAHDVVYQATDLLRLLEHEYLASLDSQ